MAASTVSVPELAKKTRSNLGGAIAANRSASNPARMEASNWTKLGNAAVNTSCQACTILG
uniref:hypothetical protein n=1 Tax=Microcystis aeruginosa TaxID=1126 RepID=UPI0035B58E8D